MKTSLAMMMIGVIFGCKAVLAGWMDGSDVRVSAGHCRIEHLAGLLAGGLEYSNTIQLVRSSHLSLNCKACDFVILTKGVAVTQSAGNRGK